MFAPWPDFLLPLTSKADNWQKFSAAKELQQKNLHKCWQRCFVDTQF